MTGTSDLYTAIKLSMGHDSNGPLCFLCIDSNQRTATVTTSDCLCPRVLLSMPLSSRAELTTCRPVPNPPYRQTERNPPLGRVQKNIGTSTVPSMRNVIRCLIRSRSVSPWFDRLRIRLPLCDPLRVRVLPWSTSAGPYPWGERCDSRPLCPSAY